MSARAGRYDDAASMVSSAFDEPGAAATVPVREVDPTQQRNMRERLQRYRRRDLRASYARRNGHEPPPPDADQDYGTYDAPHVRPSASPGMSGSLPQPLSATARASAAMHSRAGATSMSSPQFSTFLHYTMSADPREAEMEQMWIERRAREAERERQDRALSQTLTLWSMHRARLDEEMSRRREALRFTSQTQSLYATGRDSGALMTSRDFANTFRSASALAGEADAGDGASAAGAPAAGDARPQTAPANEYLRAPPQIPMSGEIWLSPYVNTDYRRVAGVKEPLARTAVPGFRPPHANQTARPLTAASASGALDAALGSTTGAATARTGAATARTAPGAAVPELANLPPRPQTATGKPAPLGQALHSSAPSARRIQSLMKVNDIGDEFSRRNIHVNRANVARALTVFDDRTFAECVSALPRPGSRTQDPCYDPSAAGAGKKAGKKKAGKKKKK